MASLEAQWSIVGALDWGASQLLVSPMPFQHSWVSL